MFVACLLLVFTACSSGSHEKPVCLGGEYMLMGCGSGTILCSDGTTQQLFPSTSCDNQTPLGGITKPADVTCVVTDDCPDGTTETDTLTWVTAFLNATLYLCLHHSSVDASAIDADSSPPDASDAGGD